MKLFIFLLALSAITLEEVIPRIGPIDSHSPLNYKVQIDDPPLTRWAPIIRDYNASLHRFV